MRYAGGLRRLSRHERLRGAGRGLRCQHALSSRPSSHRSRVSRGLGGHTTRLRRVIWQQKAPCGRFNVIECKIGVAVAQTKVGAARAALTRTAHTDALVLETVIAALTDARDARVTQTEVKNRIGVNPSTLTRHGIDLAALAERVRVGATHQAWDREGRARTSGEIATWVRVAADNPFLQLQRPVPIPQSDDDQVDLGWGWAPPRLLLALARANTLSTGDSPGPSPDQGSRVRRELALLAVERAVVCAPVWALRKEVAGDSLAAAAEYNADCPDPVDVAQISSWLATWTGYLAGATGAAPMSIEGDYKWGFLRGQLSSDEWWDDDAAAKFQRAITASLDEFRWGEDAAAEWLVGELVEDLVLASWSARAAGDLAAARQRAELARQIIHAVIDSPGRETPAVTDPEFLSVLDSWARHDADGTVRAAADYFNSLQPQVPRGFGSSREVLAGEGRPMSGRWLTDLALGLLFDMLEGGTTQRDRDVRKLVASAARIRTSYLGSRAGTKGSADDQPVILYLRPHALERKLIEIAHHTDGESGRTAESFESDFLLHRATEQLETIRIAVALAGPDVEVPERLVTAATSLASLWQFPDQPVVLPPAHG